MNIEVLIVSVLAVVVCVIALYLLKELNGTNIYKEVLEATIKKKNEEIDELHGKRTHKIKLRYEFCDAVLYGKKTFEVRKNDRGYKVGDQIKFNPVTGNTKEVLANHPIANHTYIITYILEGWGLEEGYVAFAIKEKEDTKT